jgi:hypothetical protein
MTYYNIFYYCGIFMFIIGILLILYGYSIKYRKYCVICGSTPPCFSFTNCKPNRIEGYILKLL